ncbi:MAG: hypothetical protein QOE82_3461 [Thermoanaerobaculia bacterium]|jgi:hypothetical protein|nr:hypothetical protein [Thermoanaerobaculia bacterium]
MEDELRASIQKRVDAALQQYPEERRASRFSEYADGADDLVDRLNRAASAGGASGMSAALDLFEELRPASDVPRLQHAFMQFLSQHPAAATLGITVPPLEQRAPWKVTPSNRG